jgi:hypothetical protein
MVAVGRVGFEHIHHVEHDGFFATALGIARGASIAEGGKRCKLAAVWFINLYSSFGYNGMIFALLLIHFYEAEGD